MTTHSSLDYLKELSDNNIDFMIEMIETFLSQTPGMMSLLKTHYESSEFDALKKLAHKMKPTLPMMGINGFENDFKSIENIAINGFKDDSKFDFHFNRLFETLEIAYPELKESLLKLKQVGI